MPSLTTKRTFHFSKLPWFAIFPGKSEKCPHLIEAMSYLMDTDRLSDTCQSQILAESKVVTFNVK